MHCPYCQQCSSWSHPASLAPKHSPLRVIHHSVPQTHERKSLQPCDRPSTTLSSLFLALIMMTGTTAWGTVFLSSMQNSCPAETGGTKISGHAGPGRLHEESTSTLLYH